MAAGERSGWTRFHVGLFFMQDTISARKKESRYSKYVFFFFLSFFQVSLLRRLIVDVAALKCLEIRYAFPVSLIIHRHYGERYIYFFFMSFYCCL